MPASIVTNPCCPRCGYDQSGIVASWRESCPLDGTCTECGLVFVWREVLNPMHTVPRWSFEHVQGGPWKKIGCLVKTARHAMRTRRLYEAIRMQHVISQRRLLIYIMMLAFATHVLLVAPQWYMMRRYYGVPWGVGTSPEEQRLWLWSTVFPYASFHQYLDFADLGVHNVVLAAHWAALMPVSYLVLWQTLRQVRVRRAHLLRVGAYAATVLPLLAILAAVISTIDIVLNTPWAWRNTTPWVFRDGRFIVPLMAIWQVLVWHRAARDYLKLPQPWRISLVMAVMSFLASLAIWTLLSNDMQSEITSILLYFDGIYWY